ETDQPVEPEERQAGCADAGAAGAHGSGPVETDPASQRGSANRSDGNSGARRADRGAHGAGECAARTDESDRGAAGILRRRSDGRGETDGAAGETAGNAEAAGGRSGIVDEKDQRIRRKNRADRARPVSGNATVTA